jgi:hypothetical protein
MHFWSNLGQRHSQTLVKLLMPLNLSRTFATFNQYHLNTSNSPKIKVVQFFEGHNFAFGWHFKFGVENGKKLGQLQLSTIHRCRETFKVCQQFIQNLLLNTRMSLSISSRG